VRLVFVLEFHGGFFFGRGDNGPFAKHYTHGVAFKNIINPWRRRLKAIELGGRGAAAVAERCIAFHYVALG